MWVEEPFDHGETGLGAFSDISEGASARRRQSDQDGGAQNLRESLLDDPEQYEVLADEEDAPTLEEWVEQHFPGLIENFGLSCFSGLIDNEELGIQLCWGLCDFYNEKNELLLADNPCIFTGGIDAPELIVALPISPTKAFLATRGNRTAAKLRRLSPGTLVVQLNESSVVQSRARVYARTDAPMRFIANLLASRK